jgi:hypothetical protein
MMGYVKDVLEGCDQIIGTKDTPAAANLFDVRDDSLSPPLDEDRRASFHTLSCQLLYLSKRCRPDILTAVSFLIKRVSCPGEDDWKKLSRTIQYLRGTQNLGIVLECDKCIQVLAYADASYGVHKDFKSHTGCVIGLGKGPIFGKSTSQKLNSKSSTEAELIGLSDSANQVIWTRNFLIEQGYQMGPATIYQDNTSTIALIKNGKSNNEKTRHIAIRFFFVSDRVKSNEIKVEYMATGQMLADILTKPLQGSLFKRLRDQLLNWYE